MLHLNKIIAIIALSRLGVDAAECTDAQVAHDNQLWTWAASQAACDPYASATSTSAYFNAPCSATDCVSVVIAMAGELSDCTYNGVSNKIEVQNALTSCLGGDTTDPGSPTTDAPATTAPSPAATASNTDCATSEVNNMVDLSTAAATSDECAADSSVSSTSIVISTFCGSACASKLEELATALPNCYYGYQSENLKADLLEQLDGCAGADTSYAINVVVNPAETTEPPSSGSSSTSPPSTTSLPSTTSPPVSTTAPPTTSSPDTNSTSKPTPAPTHGEPTYC